MSAVEWKKLGDLGTFENIGVDKKIIEGEPEVTLLNYVDVYKNKRINNNIPTMKVTASLKKLQTCNVLMGDILVTPTSETKDDIGHTAVAIESLDNTVYSYHIMRYRLFQQNMITSHYINYIFDTISVKDQIYKYASGLTRFGLSKDKFASIIIPIPSLAKQQEIVSHLDTFTTLISSLESELEMRRKQYEHYRNQLFGDTFELLLEKADKGEIKVSTLSEVGTFTRGRRFVRTDIMTEGTPCIHYGDMYTYYGVSAKFTPTFLLPEVAAKLRFAQENDVVIVGAGENNEDIGIGVAWLGKEYVAVHDACYIFKHQMNPLYISYYLRTDIYHKQIKKHVSSGKICSISSDGIGKSIVPVPSLETQQQIVEKLDAFEQLIQSLETEIKLRKKQYEYYREKLLTFDKEE